MARQNHMEDARQFARTPRVVKKMRNGGNDTRRMRVGIVGLGAVGSALKHALAFFHDCLGYDVNGDYRWDDILATDILFVCVGTPERAGDRLDCSQVTNVLGRLNEDGYPNPVVIRSTLRVGFMAGATARFPRLRLVYSPEFLRERSRFQWSVCPDRIVVSGRAEDVRETLHVFEWVEDAEILIMDHRSAEVAKLAHNAFIAVKVSFTNEIERIAQRLGADPCAVMDVITADRRVKSREHLQPFKGPYGGKCVPKDTRELIAAAGEAPLLRAAEEANERMKAGERALGEAEEVPSAPKAPSSTEDVA